MRTWAKARARCGRSLLVGLILLLPEFAAGSRGAEAKKAETLFDFEQELAASWSAQGDLQAARKPLVEAGPAQGPERSGVEIRAAARSGLATRPGKIPRDWRKYEELAFWVYRAPEEARRTPSSAIEVQLLETDLKARFWRKVDLRHEGWKQLTLPLRWFRTGTGRVPRWDRLDRLHFWFRDESRVWIDSITVREGATDRSSELSAEDLRAVAFPGVERDRVKIVRTEHVLLLTNAPALETDKLADHLRKVTEAVRREMPFLDPPASSPCLIVFATREEYQAFVPRFAEKLNSVGSPPQSGGFTMQGLATSFWDPIQGTLRPVYTHEFVHSLLERTAGLANQGEWLQEGLANRYQLQFHPQKNLPTIVANGLKDEKQRSPLRLLCNGKSVPLNRYWQAVTVVDTLMRAEPFQPRFAEVMAAFARNGSTDLGPVLENVLKVDWDRFETEWKKHTEKAFADNR
jgi:hypothetical protein